MAINERVLTTGTQELKDNFKEIRLRLGKAITVGKFRKYVIAREVGFDSEAGIVKIYDVYYGRASSLLLLDYLKEYELTL